MFRIWLVEYVLQLEEAHSCQPKTKGVLEIYDQMGKLVKSFVLYPEIKQVKIDLSQLAAGIYPYRIILDDTNYSYDKIVLEK